VSGRILRRYLWIGFFLLAISLAAMVLFVAASGARPGTELWRPLAIASLLILASGGLVVLFFLQSFSRRMAQIRAYVERLLDPPGLELQLPSGDDDLGLLAASLKRAAPRIRELIENLKLEGARREAILVSMVEGVLAVDKDLRVTFCNQAFARALGARLPVVSGAPLAELVRDPGLRDIMRRVLASGDRVEQRLTLPAAGARAFEVLAGPLGGPPSRGALAILHDVTQLERLERVRRDFVANVSHELRTPLTAIRGYAETLLDGGLEDLQNNRRFVEIILSQATRLSNIAADLLSLSELESSGATAPPHPVSIRSAMESALRTVESAARLQGVKVLCEKLDDAKVIGHELRLEQVFVNLLDNAVKFNRPNGEVQIEMRPKNGKVSILIGDTGIGIPSEDLPRVFERFYRVDKARSRAMGGTGLGLSIVKHAIEQMGGSIKVDSRLGEGSEFTIELPTI
jgi:two-component system phosphate regulon sensor histidine kinase PhoR